MAIARLNKEYALRLSGVGAIMVALALWSLYDGTVAWPRVNADLEKVRAELVRRSQAGTTPEMWLASAEDGTFPLQGVYDSIGSKVPRHLVEELSMITKPAGEGEAAVRQRCEAAAELFGKEIYPPSKIRTQYIQAAVCVALGLLAFFSVLSKRKTWYEVDDDGLRGSGFGDKPVSWADVKSVDWSRWEEKGILVVALADGRKITLDGWHFAGIRPIAAEIEKHHPKPATCANPAETKPSSPTPTP